MVQLMYWVVLGCLSGITQVIHGLLGENKLNLVAAPSWLCATAPPCGGSWNITPVMDQLKWIHSARL